MKSRVIFVLVTLSLLAVAWAGYASAATVTYAYDNLHRLIKVDYGDGTVIEYTYDAAGNRTVQTVPNRPPVLDPIGPKSVNEGSALTLRVSGSDLDENPLAFSATSLPAGATFDSTSRTFSWTPSFTQAGVYPVTFTVSDGSLTASEAVTITVNDTSAPTAVTRSVTSVTTTSATVIGVANANGSAGFAWFEYGPTTAYGMSTVNQAISGGTDTTIAQEITGLLSGTLYHFRFCAQVSGSIVCGADSTFNTRSAILGDSGNISLVVPVTANRIDGYDLIVLGIAFGSDPSMSNWNPLADLNGDGIVDGRDLTILAINFGKVQP